MQQNFSDFLRHGGNGEYMIVQRHGRIVGHRVGLSLKSTFPNYSALRVAACKHNRLDLQTSSQSCPD